MARKRRNRGYQVSDRETPQEAAAGSADSPTSPVLDAEEPVEAVGGSAEGTAETSDADGVGSVDGTENADLPIETVPVPEAEAPRPSFEVPGRLELIEHGWTVAQADIIVTHMAAAKEALDDLAKYGEPPPGCQPVGYLPGLRLIVKRSTRFWCLGRPIDPGHPIEVLVRDLSEAQLLEIDIVKDKFITVEEIEIPIYDDSE